MSYTITLQPSGFCFCCEADETILHAAIRQGYKIRRACDAGTCQLCECRLLEGSISVKNQAKTVTATEPGGTTVFSCLAIPLQNCVIEVENVLAPGQLPVHEVSAQITAIEQASSDVKVVQLRLPAGKAIEFYAGQYLEVLLPEAQDAAFSIASAPRKDRTLELHIRANAESDSYPLLEQQLVVGGTLRLRLPHGNTTLHRLIAAKDIVLIAASTGFSQMQAMLENLVANNDKRNVTLYWGARTAQDLYLHNQVQSLVSNHNNLHYIPVVSDDASWPGRKGFVHKAVLEDFSKKTDVMYVLGGSPAMVYAAFDDFVEAGIKPEHIISDVFDYAPRE